jgi:ribosomal protein L11 methylase PrmA
MANILSDVSVENADFLANFVKPRGLLCMSGILRDEKVRAASIFSQFAKKRWESVLESLVDDRE